MTPVHWRRWLLAACLFGLATLAAALRAQSSDVSGTWRVSTAGNTLNLVLKQEGTGITGTLYGPHGPIPVEGEFANDAIRFAGAGGDPRIELTATGTLKADGSLGGDLTSNVGDYAWSAVRRSSLPQ